MAWISATFILPFFAILIGDKEVVQVSVQIASSTFIFFLGILFSQRVIDLVNWPHFVNLASLSLIAGGCWVMGK